MAEHELTGFQKFTYAVCIGVLLTSFVSLIFAGGPNTCETDKKLLLQGANYARQQIAKGDTAGADRTLRLMIEAAE